MAVHVRVCCRELLRERVETVGSYADVAFRAGLSPSRLSQILSETAPRIKVQDAARLEGVLGVPLRTFFEFDCPDTDPALVAAYLNVTDAESVAAALKVVVPEPAEPADERAVPVESGEG